MHPKCICVCVYMCIYIYIYIIVTYYNNQWKYLLVHADLHIRYLISYEIFSNFWCKDDRMLYSSSFLK